MTLYVSAVLGAILGSAFTLLFVWLWQVINGNISVFSIAAMIVVGLGVFIFCQLKNWANLKKAEKAQVNKIMKYQSYYYLFGSWMVLRNKGKMLVEYFKNYNLKDVAICGLGRLGLCLYEELKNSDINVKYAIDNKAESYSYLGLKVITPEEHLEAVDVIIITKFIEYKKIVEDLRKKTSCQIVSLEDVIFSM
jgi:hypothetical protein